MSKENLEEVVALLRDATIAGMTSLAVTSTISPLSSDVSRIAGVASTSSSIRTTIVILIFTTVTDGAQASAYSYPS